jgi:hypothetical protein
MLQVSKQSIANYIKVFLLFSVFLHSSYLQSQNLEAGFDYTMPNGEFGFVYAPGPGFYLAYSKHELESGYHFSLNFLQPAQDTFEYEVYKNGVRIDSAWQTFKNIAYYRIGFHYQKVLASSMENKIKPIIGGEFNLSGYSYERNYFAPGYMGGLETGGTWIVSLGVRGGLYYDLTENIRLVAKAFYNFGIDFQYVVYRWAQFEIGVAYDLWSSKFD